MKQRGFHVLPPIDVKAGKMFDLMNKTVQEAIREIILTYDIDYIHFGTPCTVFSRARHNIPQPVSRQKARDHWMRTGVLDCGDVCPGVSSGGKVEH